jgi:hypothetical protein
VRELARTAKLRQRPEATGPGCCASLKMPMKAALTVPMWGCVKAPQSGGHPRSEVDPRGFRRWCLPARRPRATCPLSGTPSPGPGRACPADHDVDESFTGTSSWVRDGLRARVYGQRTCAERVRIPRTGDGDEIKAQGNSCRYTPRPRSAREYLDTSARSGVRNNGTSSYRRYSSVTVQRSHGVTPLPDVRDDERTRPGTCTSRRGKQCCYDS